MTSSQPQTIDDPASAELVANGIRAGEAWAMETLYRVMHGFLRARIAYLLRIDEQNDVADLLHDCYLEACVSIRRGWLSEPNRLMGFVRTIVERKAARYMGERSADRQFCPTSIDEEQDLRDEIAAPSLNPLDLAIAAQTEQQRNRSLCALRPIDRDILERFYVDEQPKVDICRELRLTPKQYELRKSRAKAKFGKIARDLQKPALKRFMAVAA